MPLFLDMVVEVTRVVVKVAQVVVLVVVEDSVVVVAVVVNVVGSCRDRVCFHLCRCCAKKTA